MQLHWGWAVLGAVAVGAALAWWMAREDAHVAASDPHRAAAGPATAPARAARRETAGPTDFYRWVDAHGVVNVSSSRPPAGTPYTVVRIDPNQNVVPMGDTR